MKLVTKTGEKFKIKEITVIDKNDKLKRFCPEQIKSIIFEDLDRNMDDIKDYEIKRLGNLSLCFKTFLGKEAKETDIEICQWSDDFKTRWTIASFEPEYDDGYLEGYEVVSCGDRLTDKEIDWTNFGSLVNYGYNWLENHVKEDE